MKTKKKILIVSGAGWVIMSKFLSLILPPEKYDVTVCKFIPRTPLYPDGDFSCYVQSNIEGGNTQGFVINPNRIEECLDLFTADIAILGVGSDLDNPARDNFPVELSDMSWSGNNFIDIVRKNCRFLLFLDICRPNDNLTFWDFNVGSLKKNHDHLLQHCDAIWSSYPHNDYPDNAKFWDYPVIVESAKGLIPYNDDNKIRVRSRIVNEDGTKIISLLRSETTEDAHYSITDDIIDLISELNKCGDKTWKYHKRLQIPLRTLDPMNDHFIDRVKDIQNKMQLLELPKQHIGFMKTWKEHDLSFFATNYSFAVDMVESPRTRNGSEFIGRASIFLVKCGIPIISQHYYYPSLLYPNLCVTSNSQIFEMLQMGDDFFLEQVSIAQSIFSDYEVASRKEENMKKAYGYFEDFFSEVL